MVFGGNECSHFFSNGAHLTQSNLARGLIWINHLAPRLISFCLSHLAADSCTVYNHRSSRRSCYYIHVILPRML